MKIQEAYDKYCKRILSDKRALLNIMKECIPEYKNMSREEIFSCIENGNKKRYIKGLPNEDFKIDNASISYDILFTSRLLNSKDEIDMYINVEAQNNSNPGYPLINRAIYYSSRIIAKQKGENFKHSNYKELKKVYSIWICINPNKKDEDTINYYTFKENKIKGNSSLAYDYRLINVIMLNVGSNYDYQKCKKGVLEMLNLLFHKNELSKTKVKNILEKDYGIIYSKKELSDMCNFSDGLIEIGMRQGISQGISQGIKQEKIDNIIKLFNSGMSIKKIFKILEPSNDIKEEVLTIISKKG